VTSTVNPQLLAANNLPFPSGISLRATFSPFLFRGVVQGSIPGHGTSPGHRWYSRHVVEATRDRFLQRIRDFALLQRTASR
jgi:hypothetical protein